MLSACVRQHARRCWALPPTLTAWQTISFTTSGAMSAAQSEAAPEVAREQMNYDVCIVGAGPAGLSAAIRLKKKCLEDGKEISVCIIEKGAEVGAHILSGNVFDPKALNELIPDWKDDPECPVGKVPAKKDYFYLLPTSRWGIRLPTPPPMHNKGNYVISLSEMCRWLAKKAEALGIEIYPGFAGRRVLYDWDNRVLGVATNDFGLGKDGSRQANYAPGIDLRARVTLFAEGARGSLSEEVIDRFNLRAAAAADPQTYALGIKEVWEVPDVQHQPGTVVHTVGHPLPNSTYGGGFIYHMADRKVALGLVIGLDYSNPYLNTFQEFQRWKLHPQVRKHVEGGTCVQYGARTLNEGGLQSIPKLTFPGGALIGCSAGFLNVPKIKGTHTAMLSGMFAGESAFRAITDEKAPATGPLDISSYEDALKRSWLWEELERSRNIRPGFQLGLYGGLLAAAVDSVLLRGKAPWTFHTSHKDREALRPAADSTPISYPKPDGTLTFDMPTSLYRSGTNHSHTQPSHLTLKDAGLPERHNLPHYAGPETRYCPAGVYEYQPDAHGRPKLVINAQNCLHCKACDIKDPMGNIKWVVPEGGGGPNYTVM